MLRQLLCFFVVSWAFCLFVLILLGCSGHAGRPEEVTEADTQKVPTVTSVKTVCAPAAVRRKTSSGSSVKRPSPVKSRSGTSVSHARWIPPRDVEKRWRAVVIHHSATTGGSSAAIDRWHRQKYHWAGVGYDFVIGNGHGSGDGQVEVTFRWREQIAGAHCGGTPDNWANEEGIGICLVGDFSRSKPTAAQMRSLEELTEFLQKRYGISSSRIYGHNSTPGYKGQTACPGSRFPMRDFKRSL